MPDTGLAGGEAVVLRPWVVEDEDGGVRGRELDPDRFLDRLSGMSARCAMGMRHTRNRISACPRGSMLPLLRGLIPSPAFSRQTYLALAEVSSRKVMPSCDRTLVDLTASRDVDRDRSSLGPI